MNKSIALIYNDFGPPDEVLGQEERALPALTANAARIRLLAAVIQPSDLGMIGGSYGKLKSLPAVAGREGVAEVVELGANVTGVKVGDWVRFPEEQGVWQSEWVVPAKDLWVVPNDLPVEMAAMSFINPPTAWRLIRDANLQEGDWILQNAANSAVGQFVIQMAAILGFKTLNVVRNPEMIKPLENLGADIVVMEDSGYEKKVDELTTNGGIRLALNSVGGMSAIRQIRALGFGGRQVTFGAMTSEEVRFPTRQLIFNKVELGGFWLDLWYRQNSRERGQIMLDRLYALMREGKLKAPVAAKFPLSQWRAALRENSKSRLGKVLLVPDS